MKKLIALVLFCIAFPALREDPPPDYAREKKMGR